MKLPKSNLTLLANCGLLAIKLLLLKWTFVGARWRNRPLSMGLMPLVLDFCWRGGLDPFLVHEASEIEFGLCWRSMGKLPFAVH
jgi:hypothetical protein